MPEAVGVALVSALALVVGYLLRPIGELLGLEYQTRRADQKRRTDFQFETLSQLSEILETWRYAGDTITSEIARAKVERLIFKVNDQRLRELVEQMMATFYDDPSFGAVYGNVVRRLGEVQRSL